ncbi:MAG: PDC sensor domain-containing protein [gamma proteobacterium symbiont of Bathyaustriella thionipta]|nr:PDC sensor domain-containing protein [gamma proteobacterium symbiont of Bathyaustriella thionipta]MCU7948815.1 PDC sensor domain-containing protein [gamma proteobacterium symbiont of Bathyaustriella thionipta]MCU7954374.1 PDC sensor domain-containing protein [gamma proteobacterium symbiont of Bathyaustriella thionipta]MCU7955273.1 PDC sensor domain-containing protein [gamma proteobacterium symbiont of Bathyaustriella thionipta]MCU7966624.1 PDC sensor domain-containing protein [gamma proteoba
MEQNWKNSINKQRLLLAQVLSSPLKQLAEEVSAVNMEHKELDEKLLQAFTQIPYCTYLYVLDTNGVQVSSNMSKEGLLGEHFGRDRTDRPYMKETVPEEGFLLSDAYISLNSMRPSVTALQIIKNDNGVSGYLGADFDLRDLPITTQLYQEPGEWRQIKGDPAIRSMVFQQCRCESLLDKNINQVFSILEELFTQRGMFQGVIHFSSSRATVWVIDDPYRYRILDQEALSDTDICMAYPNQKYPDDAVIPQNKISLIFESMKKLRMADETIYLRSSSINIFNGLISLTFSCDGTHYMPYHEFLDKDLSFWGA